MKIFCPISLYNSEKSLFLDTLEQMGHSVVHFGWDFGDAYKSNWYTSKKREMNNDMLNALDCENKKGKVDLVFSYLSNRTAYGDTIHHITEKMGIPAVNFTWDDTLKFAWQTEVAPHFTLIWTTEPRAVNWYKKIGANGYHMPAGANPSVFKPSDNRNMLYDVSFVGLSYGNRYDILSRLLESGLNVQAFGTGFSGKVSLDRMIGIFNVSKINIGFSKILDTNSSLVKGRDFEVPMCKGFYIAENHDGLKSIYKLGEEIETWSTEQELLVKCKWYLEHDDERNEIARRGYERASKDHSMTSRFNQLFDKLHEMGELNHPKTTKNNIEDSGILTMPHVERYI